jgi:hypothetical protein
LKVENQLDLEETKNERNGKERRGEEEDEGKQSWSTGKYGLDMAGLEKFLDDGRSSLCVRHPLSQSNHG